MANNICDREVGGYGVEFSTELPIDTLCAICLLTMRDPVQILPCSHQFCKGCITRYKNRYS